MKFRTILPMMLVAAAFATPAAANWFHNPYQGINRNIGSAPNPTPQDIRENKLPIAVKNEEPAPAVIADAANDAKTASAEIKTAQGGGTGSVPAASPSR